MAEYHESTQHQISTAHETANASFLTGVTRPVAFRKHQLTQLGLLVQDNEAAFIAALGADLGRPSFETVVAELNYIKAETNAALKGVGKWMRDSKVETTAVWKLTGARVRSEPKGVALIIGAWNCLLFSPLIGAIAAGCCAVLKPSELCPATATLITSLVPLYLDATCYHVINGAVGPTTALLALRWDHIFYTGSGSVGKVIAKAAAEFLTPVTLELGGKSPAIVLDDADVMVSARRLMWGKWLNAGQSCISPDYILCSSAMQDRLISAFKIVLAEFSAAAPTSTGTTQGKREGDVEPAMGRIVNERHLQRVKSLLSRTQGEVVLGGEKDGGVGITVVKDVKEDDALMEGEIFGPVLPIVVKDNKTEMVEFINARDTPLALYIFTTKTSEREFIFSHTRSGGFVQNDVLVQFAIDGLPFGGAGSSGYGNYHGKRSFDTFSHERAFASVPYWFEILLGSRYPPYSESKLKLLLMATRATVVKPGRKWGLGAVMRLLAGVVAIAAVLKQVGGVERVRGLVGV